MLRSEIDGLMYFGRFGERGVDCGVVFYGKGSFAEVVEEQRDREVGGDVETDGGASGKAGIGGVA